MDLFCYNQSQVDRLKFRLELIVQWCGYMLVVLLPDVRFEVVSQNWVTYVQLTTLQKL